MDKKRYRIYKAGGQQGRVMNPTAMWFAEMGAQQPSQEEMAMMQEQAMMQQQGAPQQEMAQEVPQEDPVMDIMQLMQESLDKGADAQDLVIELVSSQVSPDMIMEALVRIGASEDEANRLIMTAVDQMQNAQQDQQMAQQEMMAMQQPMPEQPMPKSKYGFINKRLQQAREGMSMDEEASVGSATIFAANQQPFKNALLNFNQENIISQNLF